MPRRGKTVVIVLLVCCAAVFIAIVWTAIATDDDPDSAPLREGVGQYGEPWPTKARTGNPADYEPKNGDIVAIYFLPAGSPLPEPPDAQAALASIQDLGGAPVKALGYRSVT